jgi:hypothetical protein
MLGDLGTAIPHYRTDQQFHAIREKASVRASEGHNGAPVRSCQWSLLAFLRGRSAIVVQQSGRGKTLLFNAASDVIVSSLITCQRRLA